MIQLLSNYIWSNLIYPLVSIAETYLQLTTHLLNKNNLIQMDFIIYYHSCFSNHQNITIMKVFLHSFPDVCNVNSYICILHLHTIFLPSKGNVIGSSLGMPETCLCHSTAFIGRWSMLMLAFVSPDSSLVVHDFSCTPLPKMNM